MLASCLAESLSEALERRPLLGTQAELRELKADNDGEGIDIIDALAATVEAPATVK